jgi:uncharacterized membrane protein
MKTSIIAVWILGAGVFSIVAQDLICSGNEPSWSVVFNRSDRATVTVPGDRAREFRGRETRNDLLKERIWRGRAGSRELVLFLRETACSDGMSDNTFPISARASLSDGSFHVGCCRVPGGSSASAGIDGRPWDLVSVRG